MKKTEKAVIYRPDNAADRRALAETLALRLQSAGFVLAQQNGATEDVYQRSVDHTPGVTLRVYTSIVRGEVRTVGADAIRVAAVYRARDHQVRAIGKATRVHRTGQIEDIVQRTLGRCREVYRIVAERSRCRHCEAPMFESRAGNLVCAELCWKKQSA